MRLTGLMLVVGLVAIISSAALGADMMAAAKTELGTASTHAGFAAQYDAVAEVELHLHHVVNCLEGPAGKNYNMGAGNVCQGQGNGIFADLKDSGMAGAHALPYAEIADQVANWGLQQTMSKDLGRAKAAAAAAKAVIQLAMDNFK
ncbi:MAG: hypothetical protein E6H05_13335 [Bacillati bacterium ANGP1]|uniref:DUF3015 domain-containing protein n=1 Tax=Candidatus Segetimicrobium genomatis TaxID=2569760 RepID=A0A537IHI1_9BACT|nr:MAG: hypothetical protein E6H05_13335 [Terrabacteria group bacterium ANGP1]